MFYHTVKNIAMSELKYFLLEKYCASILLLLFVFCSHTVYAYEDDTHIPLSELLSSQLASSLYHRVEEVETRNGNFHFRIVSDFGIYNVVSLPLLRERVKEIITLGTAIKEFESKENTISNELRGQLSVSSDYALDILARPVDTAINIAGQLADNLDETLSGAPPESQRSFQYSGGGSVDPVAIMHKRNIASQWNLDVYSSNPKVHEFLDAVTRERSGGNISAGAPSWNKSVLKPLRTDNKALDFEISLLIKRTDIEELRQVNSQLLDDMSVSEELQLKFLGHPAFSPRHQTRITHYLMRLDNVKNRSILIETALQAKDENMALSYEQLAAMLLYYHHQLGSLNSLENSKAGIRGITDDGQVIFFPLADLISWTIDNERLLDEVVGDANAAGLTTWGVITAGFLTTEAESQLQKRKLSFQEKFIY